MARHLKLFETTASYEAAMQNLILPNVSVCLDAPTVVHYNPSSPVPPTPSHDYVEIGGIKWATMNVGATGVTDTGLYFQWGDTQGYTAAQVGEGEGQKAFTWNDYKYSIDDSSSNPSKYNRTDGKTVLDASDDAVTAAWGGNWRMPTKDDFAVLSAAVTTEWVTDYQGSGVNGRLMTDKTDNSKKLFFPAAGYCGNSSFNNGGSYGYYWSSSHYTSSVSFAYYMRFYSSRVNWQDDNSRSSGFSVRGVLDE